MSTSMMFLYVESPLHAGTGRALGTVDLPIQRERTTGYPLIQAGGIKGRLRAAAEPNPTTDEWLEIFGPQQNGTDPGKTPADFAGALAFGDARLLLFPVRSLSGVLAWTTSVELLARFRRDLEMIRSSSKPAWAVPDSQPDEGEAWITGTALIAGDKVVLEDYAFAPLEKDEVRQIGQWLADHALPDLPEYDYWKKSLRSKLCILHGNAFRDFTLYATEVQTHIRLNPDTKTVQGGMLWTAESLPLDSLLYVPLIARTRGTAARLSPSDMLKKVQDAVQSRMNFGGDETTGQGFVALKFLGGEK